MKHNYAKLWWGLGLLILFTPLGLLAEGTAWGEWSPEDLSAKTGFIPSGLETGASFWKHTVIPDYAFPGMEGSFLTSAGGYILSAVIGLGLIYVTITILGKWVAKNELINK
jgi:cobalt/nickel transport system permease protein